MSLSIALNFLCCLCVLPNLLLAQNEKKSVVIGKMTTKPNSLLILNSENHDQGMLMPQLTTIERTQIVPKSPDEDGLIVFDITEESFYYWKSNSWVKALSNVDQIQPDMIKPGSVGQYLASTPTGVAWSAPPTGAVTNIMTGTGLNGGPITSTGTVSLKNTAVTPGVYGNTTKVARFTVDAQGRITSASELPISGVSPGGTAGGDLSASYPAPVVSKLQGNPVIPGALSTIDAGKLLVWDGTQWTPQTVVGVTPALHSYTVDPADFINLRQGDKKDKVNMVIFDDDNTFISTVKKDEGTSIIAPIHLPDGASIQQVALYYIDRDGNNIDFDFQRKPFSGANDDIVPSWSSSGNSGAIQTSNHVPIGGKGIIDNTSYSYRIVIKLNPTNDANDSSDADQRIYGVQIKYLQ
ncbi:MAG: hypothetical protein ABIS36_17600 [Chryseolinea sp.]